MDREGNWMVNWKEKTLGEVTLFITKGIPPKYSDYKSESTIWVLNQKCNRNFEISYADARLHDYNLKKVPENKMLMNGDVLINSTGTGTAGRVAQLQNIKKPTTIDGHMILLRPTDDIDSLYYGYAIKSCQSQIEGLAEGSTGQTELNRKRLQDEVIIRYPVDKQEQKAIAYLLSDLDEKIKINVKINNNLLQQIQLLCRSWLVDYAPFGYEQPATWSVVPLSLIADFVSGYSYKGAELADSDIAMATIKNFDRKGGFKLDGYKEIQPSAKLKPEQHAQLFDTLVAHTDLTQNAEVIGNAEPILSMSGYNDIVFSMDVVKVLPKEGVSRFLIAALLQDGRFKAHALGYVNGTTVLHLSKKALPEFELLLPPDLEELAPLANAVEAMYRKIADNIDESTHLANLRNTLLPRLMSGELDVSNIDL